MTPCMVDLISCANDANVRHAPRSLIGSVKQLVNPLGWWQEVLANDFDVSGAGEPVLAPRRSASAWWWPT